MDFEVPLNRLIFGQEDGAGINARVTGRDDGIAELAANIHARGQIENLVVKHAGDDPGTPLPPGWEGPRDLYSVSNGNRRLKAFRMIYGETSCHPVRCTLRDVDEDGAFEDSLTTAVTAKQLHPVDQYEAFARLRDRHGKTIEEIARHYGMTEHQVAQALALGHLSPKVRDAWRKGEINALAAKAFTLAADHKAQDAALEQLREDTYAFRRDGSDFDGDEVKDILKINSSAGALVEFVGIEAYVASGGKVTPDLFGTDHHVSDPKLAQKLANQKLAEQCARLKETGWSFAVTKESVRNTRHNFSTLKAEAQATPEEQSRLDELARIFDHESDEEITFKDFNAAEQKAFTEHRALEQAIKLRAYTPKIMAKAGCFVGIDGDGMLEIEYGKVRPAQKEQAAEVAKSEKKEQAKAAKKTAKAEGRPAPESTELSNALKLRLEAQLVAATRDAIAGEPQLVNSPLFEILARVTCAQIVINGAYNGTPDAVRTKLPSIRQTLNADVFNAALAKRFDADDYFASAPKGLLIKAVTEAINEDEARKASRGHSTTAEFRKFAQANAVRTGWLPKELRTVHYKGPGSEGFKHPASVPGSTAPPEMRDALRKAEKALVPLKRAAAARKAAQKATPKKRPAAKKSKR